VAVGLALATPGLAHAQGCPDDLPKSAAARRALAKEWFTQAQDAQARADEVEAVKAYACSFRIVPHAFTAYNLAKSAEKTGDLQQALQSYRNYLTLAPDAPERPEVERQIKQLEARIAHLDEPVGGRPRRAPVMEADAVARPNPHPRLRTEIIAGGAGVVALVGGIALNVIARGKANDCRTLWRMEMFAASSSACDSARAPAYASYALLGAGVAAVGAAAGLFFWERRNAARLDVALEPGGGALMLGGAF
jgi:tetratricopeptide (TPR) repeat protein